MFYDNKSEGGFPHIGVDDHFSKLQLLINLFKVSKPPWVIIFFLF